MENSVVTPFVLFRSTSKYGSSRVAAGTSSMVPISADDAPANVRKPSRARQTAILDLILAISSPRVSSHLDDHGMLRVAVDESGAAVGWPRRSAFLVVQTPARLRR